MTPGDGENSTATTRCVDSLKIALRTQHYANQACGLDPDWRDRVDAAPID